MNENRWTLVEHPERPCRFPSGPLLRTYDDLDDPRGQTEEVLRLARARVVLVDRELVRHDFPELGDDDVVPWLIDRAAVVSRAQTLHLIVNTPIPLAEGSVPAFRPTRYGRSVVCGSGTSGARAGLLDVKGAGLAPGATPRLTLHGTGLMPLGEALADAMMQWITEAIFWHSRSSFAAVPLYAVLDTGFDVFTFDGRLVPAGLQVRRAHRRPPQSVEEPAPGSVEEQVKAEVEMLLRHYGVTSTNNLTRFELRQHAERLEICYGGRTLRLGDAQLSAIRLLGRIPPEWIGCAHFAGINVQLAREVAPSTAQLVDFGQYSIRQHFDEPVVNLVRDRPALWGGVIHPGDPDYVQPEPDLAVPLHDAGVPSAYDIATACRSGRLSADQVRRGFETLLAHTLSKWRRVGVQECYPAPH